MLEFVKNVYMFMYDRIYRFWLMGLVILLFLITLYCVIDNIWMPVIFLISFSMMLLIIWKPLMGFCMICFLVPLESLTLLAPSLTIIKLIGIVTFVGWVVHVVKDKKPIKVDRFWGLLIIFLLWSLLTLIWAIVPEYGLLKFSTLLQLFFMCVLGFNLVNEKKEAYYVLGSYLLGAVLASCIGIYNGYLHDFVARVYIGDINDPNFYARVIGLGLLISGYFIFSFKNNITRLLSATCFSIIMFAVLLSGSRGAMITVFLTLLVGLLLSLNQVVKFSRKQLMLLGLSFIIFFTIILSPLIIKHFPPVVVQRTQAITEVLDDRGTGRMDIWLVGFEVAKDNLIGGVGLGNFPYAFTKYLPDSEGVQGHLALFRDAHNTFLTALAELGVPGFLLLMAILLYMWHLSSCTGSLAASVFCKLIVVFLLISGLSSTDLYKKFFWLSILTPSMLAQFSVLESKVVKSLDH